MLSGASSAELFICRETDASSSSSKAPNLKLDAFGQCIVMAIKTFWLEIEEVQMFIRASSCSQPPEEDKS